MEKTLIHNYVLLTFVCIYELRFKSLFAYVPTFSFLRREHLKQRDKWRPRGRLHSDDQVSYWTGNTKHFLSQNTVRSMSREMCNWILSNELTSMRMCENVPCSVYRKTLYTFPVFLSTCQLETCVFCGCSLATPFLVLGSSQCVGLPCRSATRAGGDCMGANSCTHSLSHSSWEYPAFLTCHACGLPSGTWPPQGSFMSQWLSSGGAYCRVPTPHVQILRELGLSLLVLGVWLENHISLPIIAVGDAKAWGLHAPTVPLPTVPLPTVPPPIVPPPTVPPPPWLSLPVGIRRGHFPSMPNFPSAFIMLSLGDARGRGP